MFQRRLVTACRLPSTSATSSTTRAQLRPSLFRRSFVGALPQQPLDGDMWRVAAAGIAAIAGVGAATAASEAVERGRYRPRERWPAALSVLRRGSAPARCESEGVSDQVLTHIQRQMDAYVLALDSQDGARMAAPRTEFVAADLVEKERELLTDIIGSYRAAVDASGSSFGRGVLVQNVQPAEFRELLEVADRDGSGTVSLDEYVTMRILTQTILVDRYQGLEGQLAHLLFQSLDQRGDSRVDLGQWRSFVRVLRKCAALSEAPPQGAAKLAIWVDDAFASEIDTDKDGFVTWNEFRSWCEKQLRE